MEKKSLRTYWSGNCAALHKPWKAILPALFSLMFFFGCIFTASAQSARYTLSFEKANVKEVLQKLKQQGGISFVYEESLLKEVPVQSFKVKDASLNQVLEQCFKGTDLTWDEKNGTIVIRKKRTDEKLTAPKKKLTGHVVDENGSAMPGVTVGFQHDGSIRLAYGTMSDTEGNFQIIVPELGGKLILSFIGYKQYIVDVASANTLNIKMEPDLKGIDEVVVTGIFTRKTESYTGSSNTVKAEQLESFGNRNVLTTIRNIEPAFNIIDNNSFGSDPNHLPDIQIRGNSSIPNVGDLQDEAAASLNTPLVILDGFESSMQTLQDMNENDIESITILKDASATAIYGSRGANGVVVITTKQPEPGDLKVSLRSDLTIEAPDLSQYDVLNAREKLDLEQKVGLFTTARAESQVPLSRYYNDILADINRGVDTYWLAKPLQNGIGQKHNLRLQGGDERFRYSGSVQYNDINGAMKGSSRETFNGSIQLAYTYKKLRFQNNLIIGVVKSEESPYGSFSDYVQLNPYWSAYDENGNVLKVLGYYGNTDYASRWASGLPTNPLYNAMLNTFDKSETNTVTNNTSLEWEVSKALRVRARLGIKQSTSTSDVYKPADHTDFANYGEDDLFRRGTYEYGSGKGFQYDGSVNLSYSNLFKDKHYLFAGIDYNIREVETTSYTFKAEGFTNENIDFLGAALQYASGGAPVGKQSVSRSVGFTSNVNYMFDNKLFADLSLRTDGASQFGSDKRFATFWSLGLGWNVNEQAFLKGSFVSRLKLRASVGTNGSQNFSSYQSLSTYKYYTDDRYYAWNGVQLTAMGNSDLQWQQKINYNVGTDFELWKGWINGRVDVYLDKTQDLISSVTLAPSNGFSSYVANIGEVKNNGFEFSLTGYLIRDFKKGISWNIGVSGIHNTNKIKKLSDALKKAQDALESQSLTDPNKLYREGY
ncbi:MAG: SusC/RagA family TonB-linked outer membrane protein, partial [Mangrovibacterium sp.]